MSANSTWKQHFDFSPVSILGKEYSLSYEDIKHIESRGNYWHGKSSPSSWLAMAVFGEVCRKFRGLEEETHLRIASSLMQITMKKLVDTITWNDNYMTWHDGIEIKTLKGDYSGLS